MCFFSRGFLESQCQHAVSHRNQAKQTLPSVSLSQGAPERSRFSPGHLLVGFFCHSKDVGVHVTHILATVGVDDILSIDWQLLVWINGDKHNTCEQMRLQPEAPAPCTTAEEEEGEEESDCSTTLRITFALPS